MNEAGGSKGECEKEYARCEVLFGWKESLFLKLNEDWCEEVAEDGFGLCESVQRASRCYFAQRKIEVEAADGGSGRQERVGVVISFHGGERCGC